MSIIDWFEDKIFDTLYPLREPEVIDDMISGKIKPKGKMLNAEIVWIYSRTMGILDEINYNSWEISDKNKKDLDELKERYVAVLKVMKDNNIKMKPEKHVYLWADVLTINDNGNPKRESASKEICKISNEVLKILTKSNIDDNDIKMLQLYRRSYKSTMRAATRFMPLSGDVIEF